MLNSLSAIITLDIVKSSAMTDQNLDLFIQGSERISQFDFIDKVEVYRGDGLQSYCANPLDGLKACLVQYCFYKLKHIPVRQSLGIGSVSSWKDTLAKSNGIAFQLAGRALEGMKKDGQLLAINFEEENLNEEWSIHSAVLSDMLENWSLAQIEAVLASILGETQMEIANKMGISQVAVHQRLKSAKFHLLQKIMHRFTQMF